MTSWVKTLRFNITYFGLMGGVKLPVLVSHNFKLASLGGTVEIDKMKMATVMLGYHDVALFDRQKSRGKWTNSGRVIFKGYDRIGHGCKIVVGDNGTLIFGNNVAISAESSICCQNRITMGDHVVISWDCLIMDSDLHKILDNERNIINLDKPITIGNDVWIACRCLLLKESEIVDGSIVAAGSTVTKSMIERNSIIGNNRILKSDIQWTD